MSVLVEVRDVSRFYAGISASADTPVLRRVSLHVADGESVAIVGPSGSGKSTLLNLIGGLDRPSAGSVTVAGHDLAQLNDDALARFRNRTVGFVFQLHHLLPQLSALENVLVPTLPRKDEPRPAPAVILERASALLTRVGLRERLHYRPGQLSGGERQRVAVVRALINQPRLLLADEPTGALDHEGALALAHLLVELNREQGLTLLVVTHSDEVASLMQRRCRLQSGEVV